MLPSQIEIAESGVLLEQQLVDDGFVASNLENGRLPPDLLARMRRFYHTAKRTAWDIDDLPWDDLPPVPRFESERWRLVWSSVVQQQLQADRTAVEAATRLFLEVQDVEAKLYYSTMVQDEARHLEGWTRLEEKLEHVDGFSPYFVELTEMLRDCQMVEEQVLLFQVLFEGCALEAFREIAKATDQTILGSMASKLVVDDAIHHRSGVTYEKHLLSTASPAMKRHLSEVLDRHVGVYIENLRWRPTVRRWLSKGMAPRDEFVINRNKMLMNRSVAELNLRVPFDL